MLATKQSLLLTSEFDITLQTNVFLASNELVRGIGPPFLLQYNVGQYYNKENSVLFSQVIQSADNIQQTLHRDVSAQRQSSPFLRSTHDSEEGLK